MADEEFMFGDLFATVRVQDLPASREVVAVERQENGTWRVCGSAIANTDGIAELGIEGSKTSRVYAFAIDHWGEPFTSNRTVAYGDIIRPSVFLGWLYRVTAPGVLPGEEPVWWNSTPGMPRPVGTAMAQAEMYFQPIAHGPVDIEWEDKQEGDPHWDNVVSLLHFDGDFTDETGGLVTTSGSLSFEPGKFGYAVRFARSEVPRSFIRTRELPIGTGDFTVECYIKLENLSLNNMIFDFRLGAGSSQLPMVESDGGNLYVWVNGAYFIGPAALVMSSSEYKHLALVRESGMLYLWLDGSLIGYAGYTYDMGVAQLTIGRSMNVASWNTNFDLSGQLDELRITKGVARYTENFTPPTEPFPNFK